MGTTREYRRMTRDAQGRIVVTITLLSGNVTVRWSEKGYSSEVEKTVLRAQLGAGRALEAVEGAR